MDGWKRSVDDYLGAARALLHSMRQDGFNLKQAIPVDPDGEILAGAHRVACAIALDCDVVVQPMANHVWAPPWDFDWFVRTGLDYAALVRLERDFESICGVSGRRDE